MDESLEMELAVADGGGTASAVEQDDDAAFEKLWNVCVNAPTTPNATATPNAKATPSANATRSFYEVYSYLLRKRCDRMLSDETH